MRGEGFHVSAKKYLSIDLAINVTTVWIHVCVLPYTNFNVMRRYNTNFLLAQRKKLTSGHLFSPEFSKKKKTYFVQCRTDTKRPISWFGKIDFPPQSFEVINLRYILYPLKFPFPFFFFKCNTKRVFQTNTSMSTISVLIVRYCNFDCSEIHEKGVSSELSTGVTPSYFIIYM